MKCATVGCPNTPVTAMHWDAEEGNAVENICQECADSYSRRPWLVKRVRFVRLATAAVIMAAGVAVAAPAVAAPAVSAPATVRTLPACASDEGPDGQLNRGCVWYAPGLGNGTGRSFVIRRDSEAAHGRIVFVSHARALELLAPGVW